jgi:flagellar basal body-associated protein FliL
MEIKLTGKKIIWSIIVLVVLVAIGVGIWMAVSASKDPNGASPYSAVYLTSGDIYFGKLSWFPQPHLTDVWYLQRSTDASGKTQVSVAPLKSVFWGPMDEVTLNASQILFTTHLSNSSQLVSGFENPQSLQQQAASSTAENPSGIASSTSDFSGPSSTPPTK